MSPTGSSSSLPLSAAYGMSAPREALRQIASIMHDVLGFSLSWSPDRTAFHSEDELTPVLSATGRLVDDAVVVVQLALVRAPATGRGDLSALWSTLATVGDRVRLMPPEVDAATEAHTYGVELKVQATPMGPARLDLLSEELRRLAALAGSLRTCLPSPATHTTLLKQYEDIAEVLEPVLPWQTSSTDALLAAWARESAAYLSGRSSLALASPWPVVGDLAIAALAQAAGAHGLTLGRVKPPLLNAGMLLGLSEKAPGIVVVPVDRLSLGTNRYDTEHELPALLAALATAGRAMVFTGEHEALQAVFQGGQGQGVDPLCPIVCRPPDIALSTLAAFAVREAGRQGGGLTSADEDVLVRETLHALDGYGPAEQRRLLRPAALFAVSARLNGTPAALGDYLPRLQARTETLVGLQAHTRAIRTPTVQERLVHHLTAPDLLDYFQTHLLAQDQALARLVDRLRMEALTRPSHQPLRYAAQGTPGTGKSESAVLLARRLGVPYVNIDVASMPDYQTASSQLLGSGRGIVGSHRRGRLEEAARHHLGAVVEISDLDHHRNPAVRGGLADLFLQVLETGQAQSAKGALFSCADLLFVFTMNLPDGRDEALRRGIGFQPRTEREVERLAVRELKDMLSGAFLRRVGTPILFEPLDGPALAAILTRAVHTALTVALARLNRGEVTLVIEAEVGPHALASLTADLTAFGAGALLEHGRMLAARALTAFLADGRPLLSGPLRVTPGGAGELLLHTP